MEQVKTRTYLIRNLLIGIAVFLLIATMIFSFIQNNGEEEKPADDTAWVEVEPIKASLVSDEIAVSGNIEGTTTVQVGFMVPGKVNVISAKAGDFISKGQLIASLDPTGYSLNKQLTEVQLNEARDEYNRMKLMYDKHSISESDFSKIAFSLQKAQVQQRLEEKQLRDTRLYSPINGVLLTKQTEVGEIITAGTPLFVVSDIKMVTVLAFVPENEVGRLHIGETANVTISALGKTFEGQITEVGAQADAASRSFTVKIKVENKELQIRPGMLAEARIEVKGQKSIIQLPLESIIGDQGNQHFVYVADQTGQKAFKRKVTLGKMRSSSIEVLSGLSIGDRVIISGQSKLSDGTPIKISK
ncbi:efflux RND transporter periplasmic adaptor subunit [Pedobacter sp. WC2501]|uniref:efflux RND transporter periplasmic adaptor subunit n=1 Tax=Pedobacter sp. WC2501 TaxID=3461400 RepID=UPI0040466E96